VCGGCWVAWLEEQKKEMNEHRLSMMNPEHQERLLQLMQSFLGLKAAS
jgi:Fe-S cluster biosynthesis and repair protein YggX